MATLVVDTTTGPVAIQLRGACVVGRDDACAVRIDHPTLSRRHARIGPTDTGWSLEDLGSANGVRVDGTPVAGSVGLHDGARVDLGRIRAWFFIDTVPEGFAPHVAAGAPKRLTGHTAPCPHCGKTSWAPDHAAGLELRCKSCGKRMSIEPPAPKPLGECAACHTDIASTDATHTCPDCGTAHHADCWTDNQGCATYGCGQVNALAAKEDIVEEQPAVEGHATAGRVTPVEIAGLTLAGLFGLIAFGVPALLAGGWLLARKRFVSGAIGVMLSVVGVLTSGVWWLGWLR
jgi:predicted RNA-binding Zn-ribbon protein involved in translation (DUF1610 family)